MKKAAIGFILSFCLVIVIAYLTEYEIIKNEIAIFLIAISVILLFISAFYFSKVDYERGVYKCKKCGHIFKPTFKAYISSMHVSTTRSQQSALPRAPVAPMPLQVW